MRKALFMVLGLLLVGCVSAEEQRSAQYRLNAFVKEHCQEIGFKGGTSQNATCRAFYDGIAQNYIFEYSYYQVDGFRKHVLEVKTQCLVYFDGVMPANGAIFDCLKQREQTAVQERTYEKQQEKNQTTMHRELEDMKVQMREDAERARVAQLTGKNPRDVKCTRHPHFGGETQVKCK